jgi:hypothetical protein
MMINKLAETNVDIRECYILWMTNLTVSSLRNRELQVNYIKECVTIQPDENNSYGPIEISCRLSQGNTISVNAYCPDSGAKRRTIVFYALCKN